MKTKYASVMQPVWFVSFDSYERTINCTNSNPVLMHKVLFSNRVCDIWNSQVYLISWLRRRLLITLEDCLIKLICLSLWCCNDCVYIICFVLFAFFFPLCWAYTPCPDKKGATWFFAVTLPNPNRSSKFFYHHSQQ